MAKALLGYMTTSTDPRVVDQITADNRKLRHRVSDLEACVLRLQAENEALSAQVDHLERLRLDASSMQPA
jgi:hypothetical protein